MAGKLTLSIDREVIKRAKVFAKKSNRSLSSLIESYLEKITQTNEAAADAELSSIVGVMSLPHDFDEKNAIKEILAEKHLQ